VAVGGKTVVVTGSTIGYAMADLKKARGDVAAFDLADGKEKWRKEVPTGVLLTYGMAARTVLPAFLTRRAERDGLVETLKAVRERAERLL